MAASTLLLGAALAVLAPVGIALDNGLAMLPPMGWRSWEAYYGKVDETKMMATIKAVTDRSRMVDGVPTSLADLGFKDVGLDAGFEDCNARKVGGLPAFHDKDGTPLVNRHKFPSGLGALVKAGHALGLTVSWYGNACACHSENSYTSTTEPTIAQAMAGTVAATVKYGFDGLKLDSCSQFNNMTEWARLINATNSPVLLENCHQGGLVPGQTMPGQHCQGRAGVSDCPYHVFRSSDDIYNTWECVVNNINSVTPYLSQRDPSVAPRSRPGGWAYPDMLEAGNFGCLKGHSACNQTGPPTEDRSQFGMWAIVSAPLVLSVDLTNKASLDRIWPFLSNKEAIAVNQHWSGSPGRLLITDRASYPGPANEHGFFTYPGQLGQSRGWQNVPGIVGPPSWQVGPCVDEWTGGPCSRHYMTLRIANLTLDDADVWCKQNASCHGFTYLTAQAGGVAECHFRDETQMFFMDSEIDKLQGPVGATRWSSHVSAERAAPLSPTTSGVQVWVKDLGRKGMALLLVNLGQTTLADYAIPVAKLPLAHPVWAGQPALAVRDVWNRTGLPSVASGGSLKFTAVGPHDSVFLTLTPAPAGAAR